MRASARSGHPATGSDEIVFPRYDFTHVLVKGPGHSFCDSEFLIRSHSGCVCDCKRNAQLDSIDIVLGCVWSGLGKGSVTAGLCRVSLAEGRVPYARKLDPYLSRAGDLRPSEHGEVLK